MCGCNEERGRGGGLPNVIADRGGWKVWTVRFASFGVGGDRRSGSVRGAEDVCAKDEEAVRVECLSAAYERTPPRVDLNGAGSRVCQGDDSPVLNVCAACKGMADDHDIISGIVE